MILQNISYNQEVDGYKVEFGDNVIPKALKDVMEKIDRFCDDTLNMKITSNEDFVIMNDRTQIIKGYTDNMIEIESVCLTPLNELANKVTGQTTILIDKCLRTEKYSKQETIIWNKHIKKKIAEEIRENKRKAKEKADILKREFDLKAIEQKKRADELAIQTKIEVEKKRELERQKIEDDKKALVIKTQLEKTKKMLEEDPNNEDVKKEIETLSKEKDVVENDVKEIEKDISEKKIQIKLISQEEMSTKKEVMKLIKDKENVSVTPEEPQTEDVPKLDGSNIAKYLDYRIVDINLIPREHTTVSIVVNRASIMSVIREKGMNTNIPGIEVFEKDIVRTVKK
jgi:hypothetical protein